MPLDSRAAVEIVTASTTSPQRVSAPMNDGPFLVELVNVFTPVRFGIEAIAKD